MHIAVSLALVAAVAVLAAAAYVLLGYDNGHGGFERRQPEPRAFEKHAAGSVETVWFLAHDGTRLEGWLFRPADAPPTGAPLVVMAPGLTGTKTGHLEPFAWRFVLHGLAVLLFDFRCFGGSDGEPRHWVDLPRHVDDYGAALAFARRELARSGAIDARRIGLWGSSFSAGSAIVAAARDGDVRAVAALAPFVEVPRSQQPRGVELARYVAWTLLDLARAQLSRLPGVRLAPLYVPAFGLPGERAFAKSAENFAVGADPRTSPSAFWRTMPPDRGGWQNKLLARGFATLDALVPLEHVPRLPCPLQLVAAERDDLVALASVERAFACAPQPGSALVRLPCAHFQVYLEQFEASAGAQARFLAERLDATTSGRSS